MRARFTKERVDELLDPDQGSCGDPGAWFAEQGIDDDAVMHLADRMIHAMMMHFVEMAKSGAIGVDMGQHLYGLVGAAFEAGWEAHRKAGDGTWQPTI